jgi:hypothetical protein
MDALDKTEFKVMLIYLRQYFEIFINFKKMDLNGDD